MKDMRAKKIVITSGKGGVGKTTIAVNIGKALADLGKRTVLIDLDFGLNNIDVVMGVENKIIYDLSDVLDNRCRVRQALIQDTLRSNLFVLPSNRLYGSSEVSGQNVKLLIEEISPVFDYVLIDSPAGIDVGFHRAVSCADEAIIVTTPNFPSIRDAGRVSSILQSYRLDKISLVVNRARGDLIIDEKMMSPEDISSALRTELLGVLPEEDTVFLSCGGEIPKRSESGKAYKILAKNIIYGSSKIFNVMNKYNGFLGSIRRSLRKNI